MIPPKNKQEIALKSAQSLLREFKKYSAAIVMEDMFGKPSEISKDEALDKLDSCIKIAELTILPQIKEALEVPDLYEVLEKIDAICIEKGETEMDLIEEPFRTIREITREALAKTRGINA